MKIKRSNLDLTWELVKTSFKLRYQNSVLGFIWVLLKPYTMFLVMYLIFSKIIRADVENYPLYLLTGVVFISFIGELLLLGQNSLLERANIILKVNFPRYIAIISSLINALINLFINLILIVVITLFSDVNFSLLGLAYVVVVITTTFIWAIGIAFLTSILTVKIRDLKNILELFMFIMQYATPVFYALNNDLLSGSIVKKAILLNPLTFLMNQFRAGMNVYGSKEPLVLLVFLLTGIIFTLATYKYFDTKVRRIAEYF